MRVLITRPQPAAAALAARLAAVGHEAVIEPLLTIVPETDARERLAQALAGAQAVLLTSANGAEGAAAATERRDLRVFAVGDATARAARAAGFAEVESAGGDVASLVALVRARLAPGDGALVHARGADAAGDLAGDLAGSGFTLRRVTLYRAIPRKSLDSRVIAALLGRRIDAEGRLTLKARIIRPDGTRCHEATRSGAVTDAARLGQDAGAALRAEAGPGFFDLPIPEGIPV